MRQSTAAAGKAVVFAFVCIPAAALAHAVAGGGVVSIETMFLAGMPIAIAAHLCATRGPRSGAWLFGVVTLAQACLHAVFAHSLGHGAHDSGATAAMAALHLAAVLPAVVWASKVEPALPQLIARLHIVVVRLVPAMRRPMGTAPTSPLGPTATPRPLLRILGEPVGSIGRRGPPVESPPPI